MSVLVLSRKVLIGLDLGLAPTKSSWTQVLVQKKDLIESLMEASTAETAAEQTPDMEQPPRRWSERRYSHLMIDVANIRRRVCYATQSNDGGHCVCRQHDIHCLAGHWGRGMDFGAVLPLLTYKVFCVTTSTAPV